MKGTSLNYPFKTSEVEAKRAIEKVCAEYPGLVSCGDFLSPVLLSAHKERCNDCHPLDPLSVAAAMDFIRGQKVLKHFPRCRERVFDTAWYCQRVESRLRSMGIFIDMFDSQGRCISHGDFIAAALALGVPWTSGLKRLERLRFKLSPDTIETKYWSRFIRWWPRQNPKEIERYREEERAALASREVRQ